MDEDEQARRHPAADPHPVPPRRDRRRLRAETAAADGPTVDISGAGTTADAPAAPAADVSAAPAAAPATDSGDATPAAPRRRKGGVLRETAIVVVSALVLSILIKTFLVQAFYIPSGSMEDTLAVGDRVLVSKLTPSPLDVNRGDIVVFVDPGGWLDHQPVERGPVREMVENVLTFVGLLPQNAGEHLIKRVIGVGGDTVECCDDDGRIMVNGQGIDEPYLKPGVEPSRNEFTVTVPTEHFWLMGDNRSNSQDSRSHRGDPGGGAVPVRNVVGSAFLIMWPVDSWALLRNPGATFAPVPAP